METTHDVTCEGTGWNGREAYETHGMEWLTGRTTDSEHVNRTSWRRNERRWTHHEKTQRRMNPCDVA